MPDILIAKRLMLPDRDVLFITGLYLTVFGVYFLDVTRQRIDRYQTLCQCRAARRENSTR